MCFQAGSKYQISVPQCCNFSEQLVSDYIVKWKFLSTEQGIIK